MQTRTQLVIGGIFIILGILFVISTVFHVDLGVFCLPLLLIGVGVWLLWRPRLERAGKHVTIHLLGDVRRRGSWLVASEQFYVGIGDVDLDLVQANIPEGEYDFQIFTLIGDVDMYVPMGVGVMVQANALIGETRLMGIKERHVLAPVEFTSPDYATSPSRVRLEVWCIIGDVKAEQVRPPFSPAEGAQPA